MVWIPGQRKGHGRPDQTDMYKQKNVEANLYSLSDPPSANSTLSLSHFNFHLPNSFGYNVLVERNILSTCKLSSCHRFGGGRCKFVGGQ